MVSDLSLAEHVRVLEVETPANTLETAPQVTTWTVGATTLRRLEVTIPVGHNGLTGIAFRFAGTRVVPFGEGEWLVGNDSTRVFEPDLQLAGGRLDVVTFNTGEYPHSHHLIAHLESLSRASSEPVLVSPVPILTPVPAVGFLDGPEDDDPLAEGEDEGEQDAPSAGVL